ncbi:MAG: hypothetical protein KAH12_12440, partial [Anaerolineales bacterium]|nr:hypothetical protein [Anaerolineales bacterium]
NRRKFIKVAGGSTLTVAALSGLSWSALASLPLEEQFGIIRKALVVKPILVYSTPEYKHQSSWRAWGGIQTEKDADEEISRIKGEQSDLQSTADFPLKFLPVAGIKGPDDIEAISDLESADVFQIYAAGGWMDTFDALHKKNKEMILFCRHKSGPVYLWYEIISPRYLRQHTDKLALSGLDEQDVVIDSQDEILWRLRALCGLKNTLNAGIIAIGGPGAWAQPRGVVPGLVEEKFKFNIQTLSYDELGNLISEARKDKSAVSRAEKRAAEYLGDNSITLETNRDFVDNCFLLDEVFRKIMDSANCRALTINGCMGTIMPLAETSACLTLSLLNDAGYLAFCESDFVVIPAGILLANISGKPVFLNDPTYPHDGMITLAHCTAPRRMDGQNREPARILTHFESDYGAAPKVEMHTGQVVTNIIPDFQVSHYMGLKGTIVDHPFMDICRSQIDISFDVDSHTLAKRMPGFHWMTAYGDYTRETGYALKRLGIEWEQL